MVRNDTILDLFNDIVVKYLSVKTIISRNIFFEDLLYHILMILKNNPVYNHSIFIKCKILV